MPAEDAVTTKSDLRAFFAVVPKPRVDVDAPDVFGFITAQRGGDGERRVVRLSDDEAGLAARTIKRRLSSL